MDNPWQFCVAVVVFICGVYLIAYRFSLRYGGIPVIITSITPRVIKELPNYTTIYGYNVEYILNGERYIAKSVEFYITVLVPGPMVPYSLTGKLTKNGRVSIDKVKTNICYGIVLLVFSIGLFSELY